MFRLRPCARCTISELLRLTAKPIAATAARPTPLTATGWRTRSIAVTRIQPPVIRSSSMLACAASTSARAKPKLWRTLAGRATSTSASSAIPRPATSETRCAASANSAKE